MRITDGMTLIEIADAEGVVRSSWSMDVLGTYRKVQPIKDKAIRHGEDADQFAHLDKFKELVREAGGPTLNDTQADQLYAQMVEDYARFFVEREARLRFMQTLPSSMDSIPSDSPPSNFTASMPTAPGSKPAGFVEQLLQAAG